MNAQITIIEPEQLGYLPAKTLLSLVERSQTANKNFNAFKQTVSAVPELFRRFEELDIDVGFCLDNEYINVTFTGDGARLTAVWRAFRTHGYNTEARPKKGDTTFYAFWHRDGMSKLFMHFSSSMCRRVQVGTKMVEQPIYETQCGELPELDHTASVPAVVETTNEDIPF